MEMVLVVFSMSGDKSRHSKGLCGLVWVRTGVGHTWTEGNKGDYTEAHFSPHCVIKMRFSTLSVMVVHDADDTISTKYHTFHGVSEGQLQFPLHWCPSLPFPITTSLHL